MIKKKEHCHALEFGCGTGLISFNLTDMFEHITLIDTSEGMIETLNSKIQNAKVQNMTAIQRDINEYRLQVETFDVIYTSMALHHIPDIRTTLNNLYAMLKKTGQLCIIELNEDDGSFHKLERDFKGHNGFNQNQLRRTLEETGFKSVVTYTFYNNVRVIDDLETNYSLFIMVGNK